MRRFSRYLALRTALAALPVVVCTAAGPSAQEILVTAGVKGGLVVHVGCGDGELTADLGASHAFLVHGLDTDPAKVARSRRTIKARGLYGRVAADVFDGRHLPYIDNVVNLIVMADAGSAIPESEAMRVLVPGGKLLSLASSVAHSPLRVKPVPGVIDEWTHYLHGPDNNAVADDEVAGMPFRMQWVSAPASGRHHDHLSQISAAVSAGGRLFAIVDEGPVVSALAPPVWRLVARDAFNGVLLWKREIETWEGHLRKFRSGPLELARRLVAVGDRVCVTLGYHRPVTALDAGTGETVHTYVDTDDTLEIICADGVLYFVTGNIDRAAYKQALGSGSASPWPQDKGIRAVQAGTGMLLWEKKDAVTTQLLPSTLCASDGGVFFHNPNGVVCLDASTGEPRWFRARPIALHRRSWGSPTLVVKDGVVLSADRGVVGKDAQVRAANDDVEVQWELTAGPPKPGSGMEGELVALSATDGRRLWSCPSAPGYTAPPDVFVVDGLVWTNHVAGNNAPTFKEGRDLRTGEVKRQIDTDAAFTTTHHQRCYRNKATSKFIVLGRTGTEFIDLTGTVMARNCWVRGACQYGVLPCNGLIYAPTHSCACYIQSKLNGFWALAPKGRPEEASGENRLTRGPAFASVDIQQSTVVPVDGWPTYRHDPGRTGRASATVATDLTKAWTAAIGGKLTAPVAAGGVVCVAAPETHTVHALSAADGNRRWSFTAGGRIDSPPTLHGGTAMFGCADGHVYCLRLADGAMVWRFRAAPVDRRTVSFDQVESVWPVTGSVLVRENVVYCTAGRSSFLDGGMRLCRLDAGTGRLLGEKAIYDRDPVTGAQNEGAILDTEQIGALPDVLAADEDGLFLRDRRMDFEGNDLPPQKPHMYSSVGLLDGSWWSRTYWIFGTQTFGRFSGWHVVDDYVPSGRIMVLDDTTVFGYGRVSVTPKTTGLRYAELHLFRADQQVVPIDRKIRNNNKALMERLRPSKVTYHWQRPVPLIGRAMVLAGDVLLVAGLPADDLVAAETALDAPGTPGVLLAVNAENGNTLSRLDLDSQPVFDGMVAAGGTLFMSTAAGTVVAFEEK